MTATQMTKRIAEPSPRLRSRFVAMYYLLTVVTGAFLLFFRGRLAQIVASVCFIAATVLLHEWSKAENRRRHS